MPKCGDAASASSTGVEQQPTPSTAMQPPPPPLPPPPAMRTVYTVEAIREFLAAHPPPQQHKGAMNLVLKSLRHMNEDGNGNPINSVVPLDLQPATMRVHAVQHAPKGAAFTIDSSTEVEISWRSSIFRSRHIQHMVGCGITDIALVHRPEVEDKKRGGGRYRMWDFRVARADGSFCWWHPDWNGPGTVSEGRPGDVHEPAVRGPRYFQRSLAAAYPNKPTLPKQPKHGTA